MPSHGTLVAILWLEIFAVSFFLAGIIVGGYGASNYLKSSKDEENYRPWKTICYIRNYTLNSCNCSNQCLCFEEEYIVEYEIFNQTKFIDTLSNIIRTSTGIQPDIIG